MKKVIFILILNFCICISTNSVLVKAGGMNPWVVFDSPSNANDFALVRSNISDGTKGFYQFVNPALLPKSNGISYGMSYNMMSLDRSNQSLSINIPLPPQAAVALSVMRSGTSNIQGKDIFNNSTDIISDHEILGMISFGVSFNRYMSVGINIKASHANLDNIFGDSNEAGYSISNKGIGIDGGFLINYPTLSLGIKVENFKSSKNWSVYSSEQGNSYEEQIPTIYKIGAHYNIINKVSLYCATDFLDKW